MILVDTHSGVPVYRQVIEQVRFQVAAGLMRPGAELPSTRALSQQLGINPMTVSKAYVMLEEEGLLVRRAGLPLVVAPQPPALKQAAKTQQLSALLEPVALAARQLGVNDETALEVFRQALSAVPQPEESQP